MSSEPGAGHHVRPDDLDARLDPSRASPYLDSSLGGTKAADRFALINTHLRLPVIRKFRSEHRYPEDQTYFDLMPIFVSAVSKVFKAIKAADINFNGFDAQTYLAPFTSELEIDLGSPNFKHCACAAGVHSISFLLPSAKIGRQISSQVASSPLLCDMSRW